MLKYLIIALCVLCIIIKKGKEKKEEERKGAIIGENYVFKGNVYLCNCV